MTDQAPKTGPSRLRLLAPLAVLVLVLAGATTAAAATGVFERDDSGHDRAGDVAERGTLETTPSTSRPEDQPGGDPAPGETQTFPAGDAGSVTLRRDANGLTLLAVNANAGWASEVEQGTGNEVEVKFTNETTRVDFNAELEDGTVRTRVRTTDVGAEVPTTVPTPVPTAAPTTPNTAPVDNSGPGNAREDNAGPGRVNDDNSGADNESENEHEDENEHENEDHSGADHSGSGHSGSGHSGSGHSGSED